MLGIVATIMMLPVMALSSDPGDKPVTAAEIATSRARADDIIRRGEAADVFENVTGDDGVALVKHRASGMTCSFTGGDGEYVRVFPQRESRIPRGDDVACGMRIMNAEHTTYATRYPDRHSAALDLQAAALAIVQRFTDARPHEGGFPLVSREGGPEVLGAAYDITIEGKPKLTMVLVSKVGEWNLKHRASGDRAPSGDEGGDMALPLMAGMSFMLSLPGERERNASSSDIDDGL